MIHPLGQIVLDRTAEFAKGIGGEEEKEPTTPSAAKPEPMEVQDNAQKISDWKDVDFVTATFGEVCFLFKQEVEP